MTLLDKVKAETLARGKTLKALHGTNCRWVWNAAESLTDKDLHASRISSHHHNNTPERNISGDILWVIRMTSTSYESFWSLRKFKTFYGICRREESFVVIIIISWLTVKLQKLLLYSQEAIKVTSKRNIQSLCVYSCEYFLFPLNKLFHIFQDEKLG